MLRLMFDAGTIQASLELNRDAFQEGLRLASEEIREFTDKHYEAKIHVITEAPERSVDDYANDATARIKVNADSEEAREEIDSLDDKDANVHVDADTSEAREKIDALDSEEHKTNVDVDLNDAAAKTRLDELTETPRKAHVDVDLDDATAKARLDALQDTRRIAKITVRADTSEAKASVAALREEIKGLHADIKVGTEASAGGESKGAEAAEGGMGKMLAGLSVVGPALAPLAGGMAVFGAATAAAMAQGGIAIGAFSAIAKSDFTDLQGALKKTGGSVKALPPALRQAGAAYESMSKSMANVKKATDPAVYSVMTNAFRQAAHLLPEIVPLVNATAKGLNSSVTQIGKFLGGPQVKGFLGSLSKEIGPALGSVTKDLVNFGSGAIALMEKLSPAIKMVGNGIESLTGKFAKWANGKQSTQQINTLINGFKQIEPYLKSMGHDLLSTFKNLGTAIGPMVQPAIRMLTSFVHQLPSISKGLAPVGKGLGQVMTALQPLIPAFGKLASHALPELGRDLQGFAKVLGPVVRGLVAFSQHLGPLPRLLLEMLVIGKVTKAVGNFTHITGGLKKTADTFKLVRTAAKEGEGVEGFFSKLRDGGAVMKTFGFAGMGVTKTTKGIGKGLRALSSPFVEFGRGFKEGAAEAGGFGNALKSRAGKALDGFKGKIKGVKDGFVEFGHGFKEGADSAGGFGNALKSRGSMIVDGFKGKLKTAGSAIKDFGGKVVESGGKFKTFASDAAAATGGHITSGFSKIRDVAGTLGGKLKTAATAVKTFATEGKLAAAATRVWEGAQAALDAVMDANPIFLIVAAIIALGVAFYEAYKHSATFRHFVQGMWSGIKAAAEAVWNWLKSTWGSIEKVLGGAVKGAEKAMSSAWNGIKNAFKAVVDFIKNHWKGILSILTGPIGAAVIFIATHWKQIQKGVSDVINWIKSHWKQILQILVSPITMAANLIKKGWNAIEKGAKAAWNGIKSAITTAWNTIKSAVTSAVNAVKTVITNVWNNIKNQATTIWNGVKSVITTAWNGIKDAVKAGIDFVKSLVTTGWNNLKSVANTVWNGIKSVISDVWNGIKNAIKAAIDFIKNVVNTAWNTIKSTASSVWNEIKSVISNVWNSIKSTISSAINTVKSTLSSAWNSIKSTMSSAWNSIKSTMTSAWNSIKSTISNAINNVLTLVRGLPGKIKSALGNMGSLLVSAGKDLINGLINGIKGAAGGLMNVVKGLGNQVSSAFKSAMSIFSPSRVMADIAQWIPKGVAKGIDDHAYHAVNSTVALAKKIADTPFTLPTIQGNVNLSANSVDADGAITLKPNTEQLLVQHQNAQKLDEMVAELKNMRQGISKLPASTGAHVGSAVGGALISANKAAAMFNTQAARAR